MGASLEQAALPASSAAGSWHGAPALAVAAAVVAWQRAAASSSRGNPATQGPCSCGSRAALWHESRCQHSSGHCTLSALFASLSRKCVYLVLPSLAHSPCSACPVPQNGKTTIKCPKIQRLVTPQVLQRKRRRAAIKKERISRKKTEVRCGFFAGCCWARMCYALAVLCALFCRDIFELGVPSPCRTSSNHIAPLFPPPSPPPPSGRRVPQAAGAAPEGAARAPLRVPGQEAGHPHGLRCLQGGVSRPCVTSTVAPPAC